MGTEFERACWGGVMSMGPRTVVPRDGGTWLALLCMSTDLVFCLNGSCLLYLTGVLLATLFCVNTNLIMLTFLFAYPREFFIGWSKNKNSYWDTGRLFTAGQATLSLSRNLHSQVCARSQAPPSWHTSERQHLTHFMGRLGPLGVASSSSLSMSIVTLSIILLGSYSSSSIYWAERHRYYSCFTLFFLFAFPYCGGVNRYGSNRLMCLNAWP